MLRVTLSDPQISHLTNLIRRSTNHRVRQRSQALVWSHQGKSRAQIAQLFAVKPDTVTAWFRRWLQQPVVDQLTDAPRSGRPTKLNADQKKVSFNRQQRGPWLT